MSHKRSEYTARALAMKLKEEKIGIICEGIEGIDIERICVVASTDLGKKLFVVAVGYGEFEGGAEEYDISGDVAKALEWRNKPELPGLIVLFVKGQQRRMHSLEDLGRLTIGDVKLAVVEEAKEKLARTVPEERFWQALGCKVGQFPLESIEEFVQAVRANSDNDRINRNLWHLDLLYDRHILDATGTDNQSNRLDKNIKLIGEMKELSRNSRTKMARAVRDDPAGTDTKKALRRIREYFRLGKREVVKELTVDMVESLIKVGRGVAAATDANGTNGDDTNGDDTNGTNNTNGAAETNGEDLGAQPVGPLDGARRDEKLARIAIFGSEDEQRDISGFFRELQEETEENQQEETYDVGALRVRLSAEASLIECLRSVCTSDNWGGEYTASTTDVKKEIKNFVPSSFVPANPDEALQGIPDGTSAFGILRACDRRFPENHTKFDELLSRLIESRNKLLEYKVPIARVPSPIGLFTTNQHARGALRNYLDAYENVLASFERVHAELQNRSPQAAKDVVNTLLKLDVVYVKSQGGQAAFVTPMHPTFLWRLDKVVRLVESGEFELPKLEGKEEFIRHVSTMPHILQFILAEHDGNQNEIVLPHAGNIGTLPVYRNSTNKYLGDDGLESVGDIVSKFHLFNPYARNQIRVGLVDPPDLRKSLLEISKQVGSGKFERAVVDVYWVRSQRREPLHITDEDLELKEKLVEEIIEVRVWDKGDDSDLADVATEMQDKRPVHIAVLFDQAEFQIEQVQTRATLINPLIITHHYNWDEDYRVGTIEPAARGSSGLFAGYHKLLERASPTAPGTSYGLRYGRLDIGPMHDCLRSRDVHWLSVVERLVPPNVSDDRDNFMIWDRRYGQREAQVIAYRTSPIVDNLVAYLQRYNIPPNIDKLQLFLHRYGHIASQGVLQAPPGATGAGNNIVKGLLGTVLAAAWIKSKHPDALIASLDTQKGRIWASDYSRGKRRADLVVLYKENGEIFIEVVEVKSTEGEPDEKSVVGQLESTLTTLQDIIQSRPDDSNIYINSLREAWKYQIYKECFRGGRIEPGNWAKHWSDQLRRIFEEDGVVPPTLTGRLIHVMFEREGEEANADETVLPNDDFPIRGTNLYTSDLHALLSSDDIWGLSYDTPVLHEDEVATTSVERDSGDQPSSAEQAQKTEGGISGSEIPIKEHEPITVIVDVARSLAAVEGEAKSGNEAEPSPPLNESTAVENELVDSDGQDEVSELKDLARRFKSACGSYGVQLRACDPERGVVGPNVQRLYFNLSSGQKESSLRAALVDIGRDMERSNLIVTQIPNSRDLALDIPVSERQTVPINNYLKDIQSPNSIEMLKIPIGVTPEGDLIEGALHSSEETHLLVGGTTGAGKTIFLYGVICSLIKSHPDPESLKIMISTSKGEDFTFFESIPHLAGNKIFSDSQEAIDYLTGDFSEIFDGRGPILQEARCRDIGEYNAKAKKPMAPYVVVVDEFADLADQLADDPAAKRAFMTTIRRVAQLGRNRGIHLVLCTQRPSADLVPTNIRTLMNVRVAFRVNDAPASRMILNDDGAQNLQMSGDLLYKRAESLQRCQGYFTSTDVIEAVLRESRLT